MLNLMIVDDEPIIIKGLANIVKKSNTPCKEIVAAYDGHDALEKMAAFRPDLLITDIEMAEMNGLELIREAQERQLCKRFIILTGYEETVYLREAIRRKVIDYLLKPINKAEFLGLLSDVCLEIVREQSAGRPKTAPAEDGPVLPEDRRSRMSRNIRKVLAYIDGHYMHDLSLDMISEHVELHPNYISSLFKKETGLTFIHYLHLYRIKKAKQLILSDEELSFQEISEQVGYENARHFFSVFKKYTGVTPGEFRELHRQSLPMTN
jgi:YesN/AraC family two-component response regulator